MELCEKLKQIRKENNLTQQQLADELCLSRTVITKYERGHKVPNLDTLILISNYFKTSIFDEYKNELKLFFLSIRCCIPYLISLILLFVSSISLLSNVIKVNNQYGYNIYNDELKVNKCKEIHIIKVDFYIEENFYKTNICYSLIEKELESNCRYIITEGIVNVVINDYYIIFNSGSFSRENSIENYLTISHKPFIYPLRDYDESLPYNEQTGECSKILNYYINLIEKVK